MKASILLICYNHEKYVEDAVSSIISQSKDFEFEIIVLDDNSTDDTYLLACELLKDIDNVTLIKNEINLGITKNYQKGFSLCAGEFIFVIEGDDYWIDSEKLSKQIHFLEKHPFHSMCFHPYLLQQDDSRNFYKSGKLSKYLLENFSINDLILNENLIGNFSVCCYRARIIKEIPSKVFDEISYDWIINLYMAHFGLIGKINEEMSVYRLSKNSLWSTKNLNDQIRDLIYLIPQYDKLLNFVYSKEFNDKTVSLNNVLYNNTKSKSEVFKNWIPPLIPKLIKYIIPPNFRNKNEY